jgi:prephenate dehydrogenase
MGAVDRTERYLEGAVENAGMVILAAPPLAVRLLLEDLAELAPVGCVITDVSSTKAEIMRWAKELLPEHVSFIGGHPMAGKEESGPERADRDLFRDKVYAIVPSTNATENAIKSVLGLVSVLGAEPVFIDAEEHDQYVAAISHLPLVMSMALFTLVRNSPSWSEISPFASSGFRDLTRLASGDPQMSHDICMTNADGVLHWLDRMIGELRRYRDMIMDDHEALFNTFNAAQVQRDAFLSGADRPVRERRAEIPSASEQLTGVLFGGLMAANYKKYERMKKRSDRGGAQPGGKDDEDE